MNPPATIPRSNKPLACTLIAALCGAALLTFFWNPRSPLDFKIVRVEVIKTSAAARPQRQVTLSLGNLSSNSVYLIGEQKVQFRVGDNWLSPEICSALADQYLKPGGHRDDISFELPTGAEACRFLLDYRVGMLPYCKAYSFLERHGLSRRFPRLSKWVLKGFAGHRALRHDTVELPLPSAV